MWLSTCACPIAQVQWIICCPHFRVHHVLLPRNSKLPLCLYLPSSCALFNSYSYASLMYTPPFIAWNGHGWQTMAYSQQKASHDMVNTWNDHNLQITPLYWTRRNTAKKNSQQHKHFWTFWIILHPAYTMRTYIQWVFTQGSTPKYIMIIALQVLRTYVCAYRPEYQRIKVSIPSITLWFHIQSCSHLRLPRSSPNICHTSGYAQARPHDAMHLPSYNKLCN